MKFGVLMPSFGSSANGGGAAETHIVLAQRAEALGFDSLWVADHIVFPTRSESVYPYSDSGQLPVPPDVPFFDAPTYLSFLAAATRRVKLGTTVLVLPHRHPVLLAKMYATLDVLSGGRMILGAGVGYLKEEIELMGARFDKRGPISDEYVAAMRELWTNPDPVFAGEFISFRDIKCEPKPVQSPLPIWFGGHSRRMMQRIVTSGQGCIFVGYNVDQFKLHYRLLADEADAAGRDLNTIAKAVFLTAGFSIDICLSQIAQYQALGIDYFIVALPAWGTSLAEYFSALTEFAERVGMQAARHEVSPFNDIRRQQGQPPLLS